MCVYSGMHICGFYIETGIRSILLRYSGMSNKIRITLCLFLVLRILYIEFNVVKRPNNTDTTAIGVRPKSV